MRLQAVLNDPVELQCLLGEYLSEPKPNVWFDSESEGTVCRHRGHWCGGRLDRRTRMMFDEQHIFINGESYRASGPRCAADAGAGRPSAGWPRAM
jgi:50S ribosomal protein L16 3-hydroxylase